ncbi:RNA polymerase II C-terminal domain-binding protein RA4 [Phytophthora cinnamomi]|uniref:RNA polymerase II C-terminal domain-binding protein RA4 n=1 Tax=Phytophthora cinnamomi TaxID=4785 RepID=UPI00355A638C|nr:RNA polymerase II C-terminal domain-binding protein RA4 [Phytophthora cinnamomi]
MGGHEHHKSGRAGAWEGFEKLKQALEGLATAKGVSQSRIGAVAKLAAHYSKFYKHVVHDIEVFLWKAEVEHRLAGLYAIDAIIRQAHAKNDPKDAYVKRFLIRLSDTVAAVKKVPEQSQPKVRHVIEEWQKRGIYTAKQIEDVGGREYLCNAQEERSGNVTPRTSPGKLASLLSIIKQKKEQQEHSGENQTRPPHEGSYDTDGRQRDDAGAYNHRSYDDRRTDGQRYERRDAGGIMGDAPGMPVGGGRIRRAPEDRDNEFDDRDSKKPRGSRCTFGDRCWHIHDPQAVATGGGRPETGDSKRKTVLCNNFPLGKCRFGDKCSFAHGEDELDKSARYPPRPPTHGEQPGSRWQPSPSSQPGMEQSRISPSASAPAPSSQARSYGASQVYNEPHGDRGSRGGDSSVSYANAAAPSPGGRRLPSDQPTSTAPTQGYPGTYATASSPYGAPGGSTYTNQGPSFSSGADQGRSHVPGGASVLPSPGSGSQSFGGDRAAAPAPSAKILADDDDGDTVEPEFTLEYDDDD